MVGSMYSLNFIVSFLKIILPGSIGVTIVNYREGGSRLVYKKYSKLQIQTFSFSKRRWK